MAHVCRLTISLVCISQVSLPSMAATSREPFFSCNHVALFLWSRYSKYTLHDLNDIYVVGRSWRLWYAVQRSVSHCARLFPDYSPSTCWFKFEENPHDSTCFFCFSPKAFSRLCFYMPPQKMAQDSAGPREHWWNHLPHPPALGYYMMRSWKSFV